MLSRSPNPSARADASYNRRRAGTACNVCRARKTKCDNRRPICGFCAATGGECEYRDDALDYSHLDRSSLLILQRIGELEQNLSHLIGDTRPGGHERRELTSEPSPSVVAPIDEASPTAFYSAESPIDRNAQVRNTQEDIPPTADVIFASNEMTVEALLRWPVFGSEFEDLPPLVPLLGQSRSASDHAPSLDDHLAIDSQIVSHLVANFLSNNHVKNPIFNVQTLWGDVQKFVDEGLRWDGRSCLILLVCAVSVLSPPFETETTAGPSMQPGQLAQAKTYFKAAQKRIGMVYHENTLLAVQCSFLTALYLMSTMDIFAAWKSFSQAGTQCLGWLASQSRFSGSTVYLVAPSGKDDRVSPARYVEESLYWSCLKSELELRTELGLPGSSLNEMKYPHVYPSPPEPKPQFWGFALDANERELEVAWFFYLAEIALRRIMNDALTTRYGVSLGWYYRARWWTEQEEEYLVSYTKEFTGKLSSWYNTLPPSMSFSRDPRERMGNILRALLRSHETDIREVVYFPALRAVMFQPLREIGPRTIYLAKEALQNDLDRIILTEEGFWHRHQGTWLMIRSCSRSSIHLLGAALQAKSEPELSGLLPDGWEVAVGKVLRMIEYWKSESPDLGILLETLMTLYTRATIS